MSSLERALTNGKKTRSLAHTQWNADIQKKKKKKQTKIIYEEVIPLCVNWKYNANVGAAATVVVHIVRVVG